LAYLRLCASCYNFVDADEQPIIQMTRILLVEDHILVRQSISAFLSSAGLLVVGEAGSGPEAVALAWSLQPDVIVMDIHLPGMSGIEAARQILAQQPQTRLIALTAYNEQAYQRALFEVGAAAFVLKTDEFSVLLAAIQRVTQTQLPASASAAQPTLLTERERQVLLCAARGWTNKQIGQHLGISDRTAQVHLQAIYHKLNVTNRTEAVLRGLALNLIPNLDGANE
jgi:DNA-binding NarL/FixJ family response regulator